MRTPFNRTTLAFAAALAGAAAAPAWRGGGDDPAPLPVAPAPIADRFSELAQAAPDPAFATEYDRHIAASHRNTLGDEFMLNTYRDYYCMYPEGNTALRNQVRDGANTRVPLTQLFDDVWYIGSHHVGQYFFRSDEGFVLLDTLNNATEAQTYTVPALSVLGLGATRPLKDVIVTHGHGDHDGGALELRTRYNPTITTGSADAAGKAYAPNTIDSSNFEPVRMTMAGREVILFSTPGHTPGSLSSIITAHDNGKPVKAVIVGGSAMPGNKAAADSYMHGVERTYTLAKKEGVTASLQAHPVFDGTLRFMGEINENGLSKPSQLVIGQERILQGLAILRQCSSANAAKVDATTLYPVWRVSKLELPTGGPRVDDVSARVTNGWGPVANAAVTFTARPSGKSCTATTNEKGIARCEQHEGDRFDAADTVTANFDGSDSTNYVDLPTTATAAMGK